MSDIKIKFSYRTCKMLCSTGGGETVALVEFDNGRVKLVRPVDIQFTDNEHEQYVFEWLR